MDALLIVGGLLLIIASVIWLVVSAFSTSLLWGVGTLIPPINLVFLFRHWKRARGAAVLFGLGLIPLVVGFSLLASQQPERLAAILSLEWLEPEEPAADRLAIDLRGELDGRPFNPSVASLEDGILKLREGSDPFLYQEVSIRLDAPPAEGVRVDVLPDDAGAPEVEISWMTPEQELPEARRLRDGYTLHLNLKQVAPARLAGAFHLVLPSDLRTSLSGTIEVLADELPVQMPEAAPPAPRVSRAQPEVARAQTENTVDRRQGFSLQRLQENPDRYKHLRVRAFTERGGLAEGRFVGLDDEGNVTIRHLRKGAGVALYNLAPNDIVMIELLEP